METKVIAHFYGGPWDGEQRELPELPPRLDIPVMPLLETYFQESKEPAEALAYKTAVYELRREIYGRYVYVCIDEGS